jgi:ribonuclease Z
MRRVAIVLVVLALVAGGVAWLLRVPAVQDTLVKRAIARLFATRPDRLFHDDTLRVLVCGSGTPLPHATRAKPCVAVFAAGKFWVVDVGPGAWNKLALLRVDATKIGGVFFTHFHSDHIGDLGELNLNTWASGRPEALKVYGPPGVERLVNGFHEAYELDTDYRIAHHGADFMVRSREQMQAMPIAGPAQTGESGPPVTVLEENGLKVLAFAVHHDPVKPAYGYRFEYKGRSLVVSGDPAKTDAMVRAAQGADVLLHEAQANHLIAMLGEAAGNVGMARTAKIMTDIPSYHTTPVEAAEVANAANVKLLVLYHLNPPPPVKVMETVFARGVDAVRPKGWLMSDDGTLVELPADSDAIQVSELLH